MAGMGAIAAGWKFWIDRGGTFTDLVALAPDGTLRTAKLLSDDPEHYPDAAVEGIRRIFGLLRNEAIPVERIAVVECAGRMSNDGTEIEHLDLTETQMAFEKLLADGICCVAIVLMHGYRYPQHEQILAQLARDLGFAQVYPSHETSQLVKFVDRGHTTVVDAYLSPVLRKYVDRLHSALPGVRLLFMQSNGGLVEAGRFRGKDSILSGPAAGVVGAAKAAAQ